MVGDLRLREATPDDIPTLVNHRRWMFEAMAAAEGIPLDPDDLDGMDAVYAAQLRAQLADGGQQAWLIESGNRVVASGAVLFCAWLPCPKDLTGRLAYLHSVYTAPEFRRRGLARRIVQAAIDACRAAGLRRLALHASAAGQPLYESLGFESTNEMRLVWRE